MVFEVFSDNYSWDGLLYKLCLDETYWKEKQIWLI